MGYGSEAVRMLLRHAFVHRNMRRVWLWCHARNTRALRAYTACGFVEEGRLRQHLRSDGAYDDPEPMGVLRVEWLAMGADGRPNR